MGSEHAPVDEQLTMNSEQSIRELGNEVPSEDLELPGRKPSNFQVLQPCRDEGASAECRCVLGLVF